jgi:beta-phosphoglucomutase-like phosphatase (HAD superfamily)
VVTNAPRANAEAMLARLGLREYFGEDRLVIGGECARAKPNPDPYLEGLKRIGLTSGEKCIAFEDSPAGARAAVAANIPVVGILSSQDIEALMNVGCALCVKDFAAPDLFDALGASVPE